MPVVGSREDLKKKHFYTEWLRLIDAAPLVMMNPFNKSQELLSNNRMQRHKHTQTHTKNEDGALLHEETIQKGGGELAGIKRNSLVVPCALEK